MVNNTIGREQHTVEIDGNNYIITALEATYGLDIFAEVQRLSAKEESPSGLFMKSLICKSVTLNNIQLDGKKFDSHFSRKYNQMFQLFEEIIKFNFGSADEEGPNVVSDISEE